MADGNELTLDIIILNELGSIEKLKQNINEFIEIYEGICKDLLSEYDKIQKSEDQQFDVATFVDGSVSAYQSLLQPFYEEVVNGLFDVLNSGLIKSSPSTKENFRPYLQKIDLLFKKIKEESENEVLYLFNIGLYNALDPTTAIKNRLEKKIDLLYRIMEAYHVGTFEVSKTQEGYALQIEEGQNEFIRRLKVFSVHVFKYNATIPYDFKEKIYPHSKINELLDAIKADIIEKKRGEIEKTGNVSLKCNAFSDGKKLELRLYYQN